MAIDDSARLGTYLTGIPIYRTVGNTNTVQISLNGQDLNLTLSTSVNHILVASPACRNCIRDADPYDPSRSSHWESTGTALDYKFDNPYAHPGPRTAQQENDVDSPQSPTLIDVDAVIGSERIKDPRGDSTERRIAVVERMTDADGGYAMARFERGSSGIWGLGIDTTAPANSIISSVRMSQAADNFTVGLAMNLWSSDLTSAAGELHWGAAPRHAYQGVFNWIEVSPMGSFWWIAVDKLSMNGHGISARGLLAVLDPGYNVIAIPFAEALRFYSHITGAVQHADYPNRWVVPCDSQMSFSARINSRTYTIPVGGLIERRTSQECWGSVVSWAAGTSPDQAGRILLGTPFLAYFYAVLYYDNSESYVGITGKHGIEPQPTRNDGRKLSSSETGGIISAVVIVVVFGLLACYYRQRNTPAGWYHRAMRRQHRMAVNQAKMVNPLVPTPHLLVGPPPIPDPPRDRIYSKPFWKGLANRNRAGAMALDPHTTVTQQQQRQQLLPEQQQATLEARQDSSPHHRHHRSQHHRHHDNYPENQQPGFFGRFRRLFRGSAPEERAEYHSSRHHHDLQHHRHVRHASELTRTNPAHSRPQSSSSRDHRDTRRRSFDEGAHSFSGFDGEASFHQSHPNGHGSQPTYGLAHDQWGHQAPMPVADQLFFDTTRHPQHMGGPMIYNEPHEAYEHRYMPPYGPIPQQQPSGYFQRLFH